MGAENKRFYFAYLAITPPHADWDYPDLSGYQGKFPETPYMNRNVKGGFKTQMAPKAAYASMVTEIDRSVGKIISLMKEWGGVGKYYLCLFVGQWRTHTPSEYFNW